MIIVTQNRTFEHVYRSLCNWMRRGVLVKTHRWQGVDVSAKPEAATRELRNVVFEVDLHNNENLDYYRQVIRPSLPWADAHFEERVGGEPLNPGVEWQNWPQSQFTGKFRDENGRFNHTYMERFWPKYARSTPDGKLPVRNGLRRVPEYNLDNAPHVGIGWRYGDLQDLVDLLAEEPLTRQAWFPTFYPEDTGYGDGGRKMCTLGYQFLVRDEKIHIWYPLRSCDLVHHFRDDCYLAVRLLLWVLDNCRKKNPEFWASVRPGTYAMHMTSLHAFVNDVRELTDD